MKNALVIIALFISVYANAQEKDAAIRTLPSVDVKTLDGSTFNTSKISNDGKPVIIDFWATWCKPCIEELNTIHEVYGDWQKETGVKLIAISLDDARTMARVAPFVNSHNWTYESYIDPNGDFKRAMNVNMPPHTFILNSKGEIIWQHVGFAEGNEDELYEMVKKTAATKPAEK